MKKVVSIIVNGQEKEWEKDEISFKEVVILAFGSYDENPQIVYTVTYKRGQGNKPEGTMVKGESVKVKDKMIFNATRTDRS
ncbi:MAG: multiubiquitin domain-containing protein [Flavobacteriales bacterium]